MSTTIKNHEIRFYAQDECSGLKGPFASIAEIEDDWENGSWPEGGDIPVEVLSAVDDEGAIIHHSWITVTVEANV